MVPPSFPVSKTQRWKKPSKVTGIDEPLAASASFLNVTFISCRTRLQWVGTHLPTFAPAPKSISFFRLTPGLQGKTQDSYSLCVPAQYQIYIPCLHHSHLLPCSCPVPHPLVPPHARILSQIQVCCHVPYTHFAFLFFLRECLSSTPFAQVPRRHTNTIMLAEDSSSPLSLNTPFTVLTFRCLTVLLRLALCCAATEREGISLSWEEKRDGSNPNPAQTDRDS